MVRKREKPRPRFSFLILFTCSTQFDVEICQLIGFFLLCLYKGLFPGGGGGLGKLYLYLIEVFLDFSPHERAAKRRTRGGAEKENRLEVQWQIFPPSPRYYQSN